MYTITEYTKEQAEKINVVVKPSTKKNKKIDVFDKRDGQYITSVGRSGYMDFPSYINKKGKAYADKRRDAFYKRFKNIQPYTTTYYVAKLLW